MDDLISRKAAIETVRKAQSIGQAHRMLVQLPSAQPGWIPCSERCPEYRIYVLVTYKPVYGLPDIGITYYNGNKWDAPKDGTPRKVIAWMPLPEPWEGKEQ